MQADATSFPHNERFQRLKKMRTAEIPDWIKDEITFWSEVKLALDDATEDTDSQDIILKYINVLDYAAMTLQITDELQEFHTNHPLPFHDDKPLCYELIDLTRNNQFKLAICTFQIFLNTSNTIYTKNYEEHLKSLEQHFFEKIEAEKESFTKDLDIKLSNINDSIEATQKATAQELQDELKSSKKEIFDTVAVANSAIFSAEPVQYWVEREAKHKKKARTYFWFITAAAIFFTAALVFLTVSVYKNGEAYVVAGIPITLPAEKFSIALLIIATTAAIWLIRVLVKLMMTNLALEIEALERSTMIKTFIAMNGAKADNPAEISMLFYSTLFKPSNNSLTDDSTSPEYIRIIEAMLQKKP